MKQADLGLSLTIKRTRKREFLAEMSLVVLWIAFVVLITTYAPEGKRGRSLFAVGIILRVHFIPQWFLLGDSAMEATLHGVPLFHEFAGLNWDTSMPDDTTILRSRLLLEEHKLASQILALVNELLGVKGLILREGTLVDPTLIAAPISTNKALDEHDPQMKQSQKRTELYFEMKAHIGVDADSNLVHTMQGTAGSVNDVVETNRLLNVKEAESLGDAGYQEADKRPDARSGVHWNIAMRPGKRCELNNANFIDDLTDQLERIKASIGVKVECLFRVIKRQFDCVKVCYRGLVENITQLRMLFALSNLWIGQRTLIATQA